MKTYSSKVGNEKVQWLPCVLCGETRFSPRFSIESASYFKCRGCGLIAQNPQPLPDAILTRYDDDYFNYEIENEAGFFQLMLAGLQDIGFPAIEEEYKGMGSFLDVGCATGMLPSYLQNRGWRVEGIEICQRSAEYASKERNLKIHRDRMEDIQFSEGSFSIVHASHLIEHLNDPISFCRKVYSLLVDRGMFYLVTPNIQGFQARLFGRKWRSAIPDHLFLFGKKTIATLLAESGFQVKGIKTWGGLAVGAGPNWLKRILDPLVKPLSFGDVMIVAAMKIT